LSYIHIRNLRWIKEKDNVTDIGSGKTGIYFGGTSGADRHYRIADGNLATRPERGAETGNISGVLK